MPTRLHLTIYTGTRLFRQFYKYWVGCSNFSIYVMRNSTGGMKLVTIFHSSAKCYQTIFVDNWNIRFDVKEIKKSAAAIKESFRTQEQLCQYLDTLV